MSFSDEIFGEVKEFSEIEMSSQPFLLANEIPLPMIDLNFDASNSLFEPSPKMTRCWMVLFLFPGMKRQNQL